LFCCWRGLSANPITEIVVKRRLSADLVASRSFFLQFYPQHECIGILNNGSKYHHKGQPPGVIYRYYGQSTPPA
jgi:hypothetical protein